METTTTQQRFIPYPTNRVVGTIADAAGAHAAIQALLQAGFDPQDIDILHGEADIHRLDPTGAAHGFLAQFQRTLIRSLGPVEEYKHLKHHLEDVRAGRFVIMVLAKEREQARARGGHSQCEWGRVHWLLRQMGLARILTRAAGNNRCVREGHRRRAAAGEGARAGSCVVRRSLE